MSRPYKTKRGKYHEWLTEDGLIKLEGMARDGLTDEQIAHNIGIVRTTLYDWKNKYEDINNALKRGKEVIDRQVENALLKRALGYEYEEIKTTKDIDGQGRETIKIERTVKYSHGDTTAQIFWLKNRMPQSWRNKVEYEDASEIDKLDLLLEGVLNASKE